MPLGGKADNISRSQFFNCFLFTNKIAAAPDLILSTFSTLKSVDWRL